MLLERRTISRKTAGDGRLEITKVAASKLGAPGDELPVDADGRRPDATLGTMDCTCRGADKPHVHYFIQSDVLKGLAAGAEVDLDFDPSRRTVHVASVR